MRPYTTLKVICVIAFAGILFSGYLSYYELFVPGGCSTALVTCGTKNVTIADLPACVYGLIMYAVVFTLSLWSVLRYRKQEEK